MYHHYYYTQCAYVRVCICSSLSGYGISNCGTQPYHYIKIELVQASHDLCQVARLRSTARGVVKNTHECVSFHSCIFKQNVHAAKLTKEMKIAKMHMVYLYYLRIYEYI